MSQQAKFPDQLEGGCRCGEMRYRVSGAPKFIFACHCTDCQRFSASAFSLGMIYEEAQFELTQGVAREWAKTGSSGKPSVNYTCPTCATWLYTRPQSHPGLAVVRPSSLDDHSWVRPIAQIYTRSALPWAVLPTGFTYDEEFSDPTPIAGAFVLSGIAPTIRFVVGTTCYPAKSRISPRPQE